MPRKTKQETISLAAAILGRKGGSQNTEAQKKAHSEVGKKTIAIALSALTGETPEETKALRRAAQMTIPEKERISRAAHAVKARWSRREAPGMSNDEFRKLTGDLTAQEIADAIGVSYSKVISWRRKSNPVRITVEDAEKVRAYMLTREHADRGTGK